MEIIGYDLLNNGIDGLRYAWKCEGVQNYIESAAFVNRTKDTVSSVCAYTTSVSAGCILRAKGIPCKFCRTGNLLPFARKLSYKEIALQNVFMVLKDMNDSKSNSTKNKAREFAYMGQGEPGFSYEQVRVAIELTNRIMEKLGQTVYRHIIATSGIPGAINSYKMDLKNFYTKRVTLHLSLHALSSRSDLMPINDLYPIEESIKEMEDIVDISGEKPCIGILLFNGFSPNNSNTVYTNGLKQVKEMLNALNPNKVRLSFCEYNPSNDIGTTLEYDMQSAQSILSYAKEQGFEAKLFHSFGQSESTACGMLGGKEPSNTISEKMNVLLEQAEQLVCECS